MSPDTAPLRKVIIDILSGPPYREFAFDDRADKILEAIGRAADPRPAASNDVLRSRIRGILLGPPYREHDTEERIEKIMCAISEDPRPAGDADPFTLCDGEWWIRGADGSDEIWGTGKTKDAAVANLIAEVRDCVGAESGDPVADWSRANTEQKAASGGKGAPFNMVEASRVTPEMMAMRFGPAGGAKVGPPGSLIQGISDTYAELCRLKAMRATLEAAKAIAVEALDGWDGYTPHTTDTSRIVELRAALAALAAAGEAGT